ncbi:hypothetical protein HgNV_074 [Homarus gammarus nudivirus]|uniref:Uncharacterized protein n=1 Tax=Homarus gammarus nudivirus TaxID=2509616 RepID=A0A411HBB1_9VIRU|nr:hypothetical protein KM727_gp74 [Homarus gammarus nudivirus]QBB28679.1 hypothetical protein HgNV_074 [Homarus gammarus nudivirus]
MLDVINSYINGISDTLQNLENSKQTANKFYQTIVQIFNTLKKQANEAQNTLTIKTDENIRIGIDKIRIDELLQKSEAENISDGEQTELQALLTKHVSINLNNYSSDSLRAIYFNKAKSLTKYIKSTTKTMTTIYQLLERDIHELSVTQSTIREKLTTLKQQLVSNLQKTLDFIQKQAIITSAQSKIDRINLIINKYNNLIDRFNNMGQALGMMNITYINTSGKRLLYLNIDEYHKMLGEYSSYSSEMDDSVSNIHRLIEDFFKNNLNDVSVDFIKIEEPNLDFAQAYYIDEATSDIHMFDLSDTNIRSSTAAADQEAGTVPPEVNENSKITITDADWNSAVITPIMLAKYAEVCAFVAKKYIKINMMDVHATVNMYLNFSDNEVVILLKHGINTILFTDLRQSSQLPDNIQETISSFPISRKYIYNTFALNEAMMVLYLISVNNINGVLTHTPLDNPVQQWQTSVVTKSLIPFFAIQEKRTDINVVAIGNSDNKKRKV